MLITMMNILLQIINVNSEPSNEIITSIIVNSKLYDEFIKYLRKQDIKNEIYLKFLYDFLQFLRKIYDKYQNFFERLSEQINFLDDPIVILNEYINIDVIKNNINILNLILNIISLYNEIKRIKKDLLKEKILGKNKNNINNINNINSDIKIDYKETSVIISSDEIYGNITKKIGKHIPKGPYASAEQYINTLFYLEYEDCYRSLRNSIANIKTNKNDLHKIEKENRDIYYYINAYIIGFEITKNGIILTIDFDSIQRVIKFTKRMIFGSLLLLTDDNNQEYLLVTVYFNPYVINRNLKDKNKKEFKVPKPPRYRIQAQLVNLNKESFNFILEKRNKKLQIFESKAYFESYIYTLKRLKKMVVKDIPFQNELINARFNKDDMLPYFIAHNRYLSYNGEYIVVKENKYPQSLINSLDSSQFNAIKVCLNNEIGIIQGPPGTGKTHVGAILTNILLQNIKNPILIVCYTNHALDQFIQHLIPFTSNIVRIGGRCTNENVKQFQLNKQGRFRDKNIIGCNKEIERICDEIRGLEELLNNKKRLDFNDFILYYNNIFDKIKKDFFEKFNEFKKSKIPDNILYKLWSDQMELDFFIEKNFINRKNNSYNKLYEKFYYFNYDDPKIIKFDDDIINNRADEDEEDEDDEDDSDEINENYNRLAEGGIDMDDYQNNNFNRYENNIDLNDLNIQITKEQFDNIIANNNMWNFGPKIRKCLIKYFKGDIIQKKFLNKYNDEIKTYKNLLKRKNELELMNDSNLLKKSQIVGMTTTGCAKYSTIIEQNNFEVVIIEEAAEVLESHIVALLTKNTKHLIMIGDHKQLRPKPYNYQIAHNYHFDVSMFERLINNNIQYATLKYQRRMKPLFAEFVRIIYGGDTYIDHEKVKNREPIKGIEKDMYIITHNNLETENANLASKSNEYEAKYLIRLCNYLLQQNYTEDQITILTLYVGQVLLLRKEAKKYNINVRISSVDNYQGEECDIILLSLVRSNKKFEIGFLKTFNRVCVAFSRARYGFYIIGNLECIIKGEELNLTKKENYNKPKNINIFEQKKEEDKSENKMESVWKQIKELAEKKNIIGDKLNLCCQRHKKITTISNINDFANVPEGGCNELCKERLNCGHVCEKPCHALPHEMFKCRKPCQRILPCKHKCTKYCYEECGNCLTKVTKTLPCGHSKVMNCSDNIYLVQCEEYCNKLLSCGHRCELKCFEQCNSEKCIREVDKILPCGHSDLYPCGMPIYKIKCKKPCKTKLSCGHECLGTCGKCINGTCHIPCQKLCEKGLICGHRCQEVCSLECMCKQKCPNICSHGYCAKKCCEKCVDCVEKCVIGCEHRKCEKLCYELCDIGRCNEPCKKKLKCGHNCIGICGERCPNVCRECNKDNECFEIFFGYEQDEDALFYMTKCNHTFEVKGLDYQIDNDNKISMIVCPRCKTILCDEPRYQNVIKEKIKYVQQVKQVLLKRNGDLEYQKKSQKIINKLIGFINSGKLRYLNENNYFQLLKNQLIISNQLIDKFNPDNINSQLITTYNLLCLLEKFMSIEYIANYLYQNIHLIVKNSVEELFIVNYNAIQEHFKSFIRFNNDFLKDLSKKINNLCVYAKYLYDSKFTNNLNFSIENIHLIRKLKQTNFNINEDEIQIHLMNDDYKTIEMLKSLGTTWYRCPKGHFYVVGECGGPMQNAICPECHERIGGQGHIPNPGNQRVNVEQMFRNIHMRNDYD